MATPVEIEAMRRALDLARVPGPLPGPNPRVGCVLLTPEGAVIAEGYHRGAGSPHAEAEALAQAGVRARGATAVVTLEPCDHTGRTPPCSHALLEAGIARVVYAQADPHPVAAGGAARLARAGVDVEGGVFADEARDMNEAWTFAVTRGRPMITWKTAASLDGRVAASDGSSRWITGEPARTLVHSLRAEVGAIIVGTGTVVTDDPHLTARTPDGRLAAQQPVRVVVGTRDLPSGCRVTDDAAPTLHLQTRDPRDVVAALQELEVRHALLEGGPTLAAAFLSAGLIDRVEWYVAPLLLGAGAMAIGDFGVGTLANGVRLSEVRVDQVGEDARIRGVVDSAN